MARVTIEDCLENVVNRFQLVHLTADRVRQIIRGSLPLVECDNKDIVTVLREIATGDVKPKQIAPVEEDEAALKIDIDIPEL